MISAKDHERETTETGEPKNYWQVAAGSQGRDFSQRFLYYGLAFVGGRRNGAILARVRLGDVFILKEGRSKIRAVGIATSNCRLRTGGDKTWLRDFDGWDLPSYCSVEWYVPPEPIPVKGLARATISAVNLNHLRRVADELLLKYQVNNQTIEEPWMTKDVDDKTILNSLVAHGLSPSRAGPLISAIGQIRLLASYYYYNVPWEEVREHETRTLLIVPLLLALGWSEQRIKIELPVSGRGRADIALFSTAYKDRKKDAEKCVMIIESKGFSHGLDFARGQAANYARKFPSCELTTVSNGYVYKVFKRINGEFSKKPAAYLNLLRPTERYPLDPDEVDGCNEALRLLLP